MEAIRGIVSRQEQDLKEALLVSLCRIWRGVSHLPHKRWNSRIVLNLINGVLFFRDAASVLFYVYSAHSMLYPSTEVRENAGDKHAQGIALVRLSSILMTLSSSIYVDLSFIWMTPSAN